MVRRNKSETIGPDGLAPEPAPPAQTAGPQDAPTSTPLAAPEELSPLPAGALLAGRFVVEALAQHSARLNIYRARARGRQRCPTCGGLAPDDAIRAAGMLVKGTGDRSSRPGVPGTRAPRLGLDEVTAKLPAVPFTVADLAGSIDREVATARNYVPKLLEAGIIVESGVDESAPGPRKPRLYTRT